MTALQYLKDRACEPVSGVGGTAVSLTALMSLDPHNPQFWIVLITGILQVVLPEIKWFKHND